TSGWESFPTANSTFNITSDSNSGMWAAEVFNNDAGSSAVIKQANLGIGAVNPGDLIEISFAATGEGAIGGVVFAEFFSEIDGGGSSSSEILGGGPLSLPAVMDGYQDFSFTTVAGPDVSGGVTLQFATVTGADSGSVSILFVDDASVRVVPEPSALSLLGLGCLAFLRRRR
ncbi:MAG: PEP-CTERM sorting domain-containing protein, partial [Planctomycetota bacterium]